MKLGILSREYPPLTHVGGIATYSHAAARLLADHGHDVHVVCNGPAPSVDKADGITVHRVPMLPHHFPGSRLWYPYRHWYRRTLPHYLDALTWARTAAAYLGAGRGLDFAGFDAWEYPETMGEGALLASSAAERNADGPRRGPRLIARIHTGWMDEYADNPLERFLILRLQRRACLRAHRTVSPTRHMAAGYAHDVLGLRKEVAVSRNPLRLWDEPVDWPAKSMSHILYVGRVEHRKGLQVLLRALDSLGDAARGLTLRVVGHKHAPTRDLDRDCIALLESRLADPARKYALEYPGPCAHGEMRRHYDWAGMLVIPSLMENYPYAALEGLSRGCYLAGSEVGGLPEIIDRPGRGRLFPREDASGLARILLEMGKSGRELPDSLRENTEETRAEFAPDACYRRLLNAYGEDLHKRPQS